MLTSINIVNKRISASANRIKTYLNLNFFFICISLPSFVSDAECFGRYSRQTYITLYFKKKSQNTP